MEVSRAAGGWVAYPFVHCCEVYLKGADVSRVPVVGTGQRVVCETQEGADVC